MNRMWSAFMVTFYQGSQFHWSHEYNNSQVRQYSHFYILLTEVHFHFTLATVNYGELNWEYVKFLNNSLKVQSAKCKVHDETNKRKVKNNYPQIKQNSISVCQGLRPKPKIHEQIASIPDKGCPGSFQTSNASLLTYLLTVLNNTKMLGYQIIWYHSKATVLYNQWPFQADTFTNILPNPHSIIYSTTSMSPFCKTA